jgi:SAM-dependent methyltransferase
MLFDDPYYIEINEARWLAAEKILKDLASSMEQTGFSDCIDIGCGPGWFTQKLLRWASTVRGLEGRPEIVHEAQRRVKDANFYCANIESEIEVSKIKPADLVFCFGLLYHTENPFRVVRNLYGITKKFLLIETIVIPGAYPISWLVTEGNNETQGITHHAMIPSCECLVQMLYIAGFNHVYEHLGQVNHPDFKEDDNTYQRRKIFLATHGPLVMPDMIRKNEPLTPKFSFMKATCPLPTKIKN